MNGKQSKILNSLGLTKMMKRNWRKLTQKQKCIFRKKGKSAKERGDVNGRNMTYQMLMDIFEK